MVIHEYSDSSLPKIVLLHPMLADARCMLRLTESMKGEYCAIIPDLSGQGEIFPARQRFLRVFPYMKTHG